MAQSSGGGSGGGGGSAAASGASGASGQIASGVQGVLSAIAIVANTIASNKMYKVLVKQEQAYLQNAMVQSERAKFKGDILLSNLVANHTIAQGRNELAVAAQGQNMARSVSGSSLDVLVRNRKYQIRDERTTALNTLYEIENIKRDSYINAISTAGQAMGLAYSNMSSAIATGFGTINSIMQQTASNTKQINQQAAASTIQANNYNSMMAQNAGIRAGQAAGQIAGSSVGIITPTAYRVGSTTANNAAGDFQQLHIGY
jgi:hypothetical protein